MKWGVFVLTLHRGVVGPLPLGVTGADGRVEHTARVMLPLNPATGSIDTSQPAYQKTEAEAPITLD